MRIERNSRPRRRAQQGGRLPAARRRGAHHGPEGGRNQSNRAQCRVKSGTAARLGEACAGANSPRPPESGVCQASADGIRRAAISCADPLGGATGVNGELESGALTQQHAPRQSAQAQALASSAAGNASAGPKPEAHCAHSSSTLPRMAANVFMRSMLRASLRRRKRGARAGYFFLAASASWSFLRYLAGSLSKSFLQDLQQSLISWP